MGRNNYFQFKQFKIIQEKAAMKVGTDGALLGAWVNVNGANSVLDVGTGTGLIALMIAQRSTANILGIEIEKDAAEEAQENVNRSKWNARVDIQNISFQQFEKSCENKFDLIVSNPPFFSNSFKNEEENRAIARHNHLLSFSDLIKGVASLLNEKGSFAVVLPYDQLAEFSSLAEQHGLNPDRLTLVKPKEIKQVNRILIEYSKESTNTIEDSLAIYLNDGMDYTEEYKDLTRDFYLKF